MSEEKNKNDSFLKTLATAIVLGCLVCFGALIYALYQASTPETRLSVMLPYAIPFGVLMLACGASGMIAMTNHGVKKMQLFGLFGGFAAGAYQIVEGVFCITLFNNLSIGISVIGIAICLLVLSFFGIAAYKELP